MKNLLFACLLTLSLSACTHAWVKESQEQEGRLWTHANERAVRECAAFPMSMREKRLDADRCVANIVRETVMPYALYPDLVAKLIAGQSAVSRNFADGKIDLPRANAEARQLQARYQAETLARLNEK